MRYGCEPGRREVGGNGWHPLGGAPLFSTLPRVCHSGVRRVWACRQGFCSWGSKPLRRRLTSQQEGRRSQVMRQRLPVCDPINPEDRQSDQRCEAAYHPSSSPSWENTGQIVGHEVTHSKGRAYAGSCGDYRKSGSLKQAPVTGQSEVLEMVGITVKNLNERRGDECPAPWPQGSKHLCYGVLRKLQVLQNRLAMKRVDRALGIGKRIGVSHDVYVGKSANVEIDQSRMNARRSTADRNAKSIVREAGKARAKGSLGLLCPHIPKRLSHSSEGGSQKTRRALVLFNHAP